MSESQLPTTNNSSPLILLRQRMSDAFSLDELRTLCFDLKINYEELPYPGLTPKIRSLIQQMIETGRLGDLVTAISRTRPQILWPSLTDLEDDTWPASEFVQSTAQPFLASAQGEGATVVGPRGVYIAGDNYGTIITGDIYNEDIDGSRFYSPDITTAVKNFFFNYLGDEVHPVPFGGRTDVLMQLEQWRTQADAPPRLLLSAPAGRGKSALLVRWSAYLQSLEKVEVIFVPISIRFNTNQETETFSLLATRLAHLYRRALPSQWGNFPASAWRRLIGEYLQAPPPDGSILLLIIDGLDEAAWQPGADLFPHKLPERVRLVVSARYQGGSKDGPGPWLRLLDWEGNPQMATTLELEKLTKAGIQEVLQTMGHTLGDLSQTRGLVAELYRLSEGDPLLVELYVKELWRKGEAVSQLLPKDLREIQPGYIGYFEKWWADQEKLWGVNDPLTRDLVPDLIDLLSIAFGPLTTEALRQLLPRNVSSRDLKRAIRPLSRIVNGDGQTQGFTFAHPKLGEYFRNQMDPDEQANCLASFLNWGKRTVSQLSTGQIRPLNVPRYLLLYYGHHLEEAEAHVADFLQLISWGWLEAWYRKSGAYAGFLQDVDRVWKRVKKENRAAVRANETAPYLGAEIFCSFCFASINTISENIPLSLLALLLENRLWTEDQIFALINQQNKIKDRLVAFAYLYPFFADETKKKVQGILSQHANQWCDQPWFSGVLKSLAPYLPDTVLYIAHQIKSDSERFAVFKSVAPYVSDQALLALLRQAYEDNRAIVLSILAERLPQKVFVAMTSLNEANDRLLVLRSLARHIPQTVITEVGSIAGEQHQATLLAELAPFLPTQVLALAQSLKDKNARASVYGTLAYFLPAADSAFVLAEFFITVREAPSDQSKVWLLQKALPYFPEKVFDESSSIVEVIDRYHLFEALGPYLPDQVLLEAQRQAVSLYLDDQEWITINLLLKIAPLRPNEVFSNIHLARTEEDQATLLIGVAPYLPEKVFDAVQSLTDERYRANVLMAVAPHLSLEQREASLMRALKAYRKIEDIEQLPAVLLAVVSTLGEKTPVAVWEALFLPAGNIPNEWKRAEILKHISPHLPLKVLAATRRITDLRATVYLLSALSPYIPNESLLVAKEITAKEHRINALMSIVPYLSDEQSEVVWNDIEETILAFWDKQKQARLFKTISPHLPQELRINLSKAILKAAKQERYDYEKEGMLQAIAPYLPKDVLVTIPEIESELDRARVLVSLAPFLPEDVLLAGKALDDELGVSWVLEAVAPHLPEQTLDAVKAKKLSKNRAKVLKAIVLSLEKESLTPIWQKIHTYVQEIENTWEKAEILAAISTYMRRENWMPMISEILRDIGRLHDQTKLAQLLMAVANFSPKEALAESRRITNEKELANVLIEAAPFLPQETLAKAREMKHIGYRTNVLAAIAPQLPQEVFEATGMNLDSFDYKLLETIAPYLPKEALEAAGKLDHEWYREVVFTVLNQHLITFPKSALYELWQESLSILCRRSRPHLLSDIKAFMPVICHLGGETAVFETWQAIQTTMVWWP